MAILGEITVVDNDLSAICPEVTTLKFTGQSDFANEIAEAKREVYGMIKDHYRGENPTVANADVDTALAKVKDYADQDFLKNKIAKTAIAIIMRQNKQWDDMQVYRNEANAVPLLYYIDTDDDDVAGESEEKDTDTFPSFHR